MRVLTVAMGLVQSEFFSAYEADVKLLENSYYTPIKSILDKMMKPEPSGMQISTEAYAERVVRNIENGNSGKIYVGGLATIARLGSWMLPGWLRVSFLFFFGLFSFLYHWCGNAFSSNIY